MDPLTGQAENAPPNNLRSSIVVGRSFVASTSAPPMMDFPFCAAQSEKFAMSSVRLPMIRWMAR